MGLGKIQDESDVEPAGPVVPSVINESGLLIASLAAEDVVNELSS